MVLARRIVLLLTLSPALGCGGRPASAPAPAPAARRAEVAIENQSAINMDIYVRTRDSAVPLGFVPSQATSRFAITPGLIAGAGVVRFEARPQREGERVVSEPFTVRPGEQLTWVIPPQ
jgi:hypothetical protein